MKAATFPCPHCSSPLRIRDRAFVEREVGCPECGERLEVTLDRDQEPVAHKIASKEPEPKLPPRKRPARAKKKSKIKKANLSAEAAESSPAKPVPFRAGRKPLLGLAERFPAVPQVLFSPVAIAWFVAGVVGVALLVMAWPTAEATVDRETNSEGKPAIESNPIVAGEEENLLATEAPAVKRSPKDANDPQIVERMTNLGKMIQDSIDRRGHFPHGTVELGDQLVEDRFSWLSDLLVQAADRPLVEPQWDQPWNDPLNDRFVRQQREEFLNPAIPDRVGQDRYPATHFVGVAGVGADAPTLPVTHPRAGIFGVNRITRVKDITDGTAETMMVAGVMDHLGSWAAAGSPTIRAFTQEPYIEGPDGFGTGQADGMSVLMADGSVRFLNKDTNPAIVRQMAAMADGAMSKPPQSLPAKPEHPSGPNSPPAHPLPEVVQDQPNPKAVSAEKPDPAESPTLPEAEQPEPQIPVDIPAALAVKIVKFEQVKAVSFDELLFQVAEMSGVPIRRGDDLPEAQTPLWTEPVSLRLNDATVGQVLDALLRKANLRYTIESDHIQLHKAK